MIVLVSYPCCSIAPGQPRPDRHGERPVQSYRVLQPPAFVNQYAAMPSLHSGWDLLVGMSIIAAASSIALKVVGFAMPVLMAFAVVATANQYVVDVVAGVTLVLVGHAVGLGLERRRERHRQTNPTERQA